MCLLQTTKSDLFDITTLYQKSACQYTLPVDKKRKPPNPFIRGPVVPIQPGYNYFIPHLSDRLMTLRNLGLRAVGWVCPGLSRKSLPSSRIEFSNSPLFPQSLQIPRLMRPFAGSITQWCDPPSVFPLQEEGGTDTISPGLERTIFSLSPSLELILE